TNKKIISGAVVTLLILGSIPAYAQDETSTSTTDNNVTTTDVRPDKESIKERREAKEAERQERLEEVRKQQEQVRTDRAQNADEIKERVNEQRELRTLERADRAQEFVRRTIARVNNIADKMESF